MPILPLNLQFFASVEGNQVDVDTSAGAQNTDSQTETQQAKEIMIPKTRFDEVNTRYKTESEQRQEFERLYQDTAKERDELKKQSESNSTRVQQLESTIGQLLESKLENIPEEFRDLIPENFNPEEKLVWLLSAEKKGLFNSKQSKPIGGATNFTQQQTVDLNTLSPSQLLKVGYGAK